MATTLALCPTQDSAQRQLTLAEPLVIAQATVTTVTTVLCCHARITLRESRVVHPSFASRRKDSLNVDRPALVDTAPRRESRWSRVIPTS